MMEYSKRTWHFAVFSIIIVGVFYVSSFIARSPSFNIDQVLGFLIILLIVCCILGVYTGLRALAEPANHRKWLGLLINIVVLTGIIFYMFF